MIAHYQGFELYARRDGACYACREDDRLMIFDTCDMGEVAWTERAAIAYLKERVDAYIADPADFDS